MNGCSHKNSIYQYRGLFACKKCGIVFGHQLKIEDKFSNKETFQSINSIKQKSKLMNSKKFSISVEFQIS